MLEWTRHGAVKLRVGVGLRGASLPFADWIFCCPDARK